MPYRRVLTMQDISCVGQCSMTVVLPILSACAQETCVMPTAVLSTHTGGFGKPAVEKLLEFPKQAAEHWQQTGISFDAVYTGYLGSVEAIDGALHLIDTVLAPGGKVIVDPAMADHGKLYAGFDDVYVRAMARLCSRADVLLPNLTEAALLTGNAYQENGDASYVCQLLTQLSGKTAILTGVGFQTDEMGFALRTETEICFYHHPKLGRSYHGTGDIFASAFVGSWMAGKTMMEAAQIAADFTCLCIRNTEEDPAHWYGVKFETALPELIRRLNE